MRQESELNILENCNQCIHQIRDKINPNRLYCAKLTEKHGFEVEICVNKYKHFPTNCPLPKV